MSEEEVKKEASACGCQAGSCCGEAQAQAAEKPQQEEKSSCGCGCHEHAAEQKAPSCGCAAAAAAAGEAKSEPKKEEPKVDPVKLLQDQLATAQSKAAANYDLYVRAVAELQNTRKRCADDVMKASKFAIDKFAEGLLPVVDSLEKALEITADAKGPMREGLLATHRQMMHALEVSGLQPIDPAGQKFDPNMQQAISMVPAAAGQQPGTVAQVFQRGWKIHDRVLRPAMVSVVQG